MNDVNVIMTRSNDTFVTLQGRADMANRKHADIFISIHANSVDKKSPMFTSVNGAAVYTLGLQRSETNLSVAMRENAVMKLEPDYSTTYEGFDPSSAESYIAFEMMQHTNLDQSIELAEAVQNQLVRTAGRKNNGVRRAPFGCWCARACRRYLWSLISSVILLWRSSWLRSRDRRSLHWLSIAELKNTAKSLTSRRTHGRNEWWPTQDLRNCRHQALRSQALKQ